MTKLLGNMQGATADPASKSRFASPEYADKSGREFFEACFRTGILGPEDLGTVVCLGGADSPADRAGIGRGFELPAGSCSYTAPKMGELRKLMNGKERTVLFTFNSANWGSYDSIGYGALVAWSDGAVEYLTLETAAERYEITEAEWADPGQHLFGRKAPFKHTFE
jgi:hypothetical protein